jgi:hypothetical protein
MNLVQPMPGEDAGGLLSRLMYANGFASLRQIKRALISVHKARNGDFGKIPLFAVLADLLEIDRTKFLMSHTVIPVTRVVHFREHQFQFGDLRARNFPMETGFRPEKGRWWLCRRCIAEDLSFHGFSFWRRSHQLPGIDWCTVHDDPLECVVRDEAVLWSPNENLQFTRSPDPKEIQTYRINPTLARMAQIMNDCLSFDRPLDAASTTRKLRALAVKKGLRTSTSLYRRSLADLAVEQLPGAWLDRFFAGLVNRTSSAPFLQLENVFRSSEAASVALPFFLACALLHEDSNAILNHLLDSTVKTSEQKKQKRPEGFWDSEEFAQSYIEHGGSVTRLAESKGLEPTQTIQALARRGMPSIPVKSTSLRSALLDFFDGVPLEEACQNHGIHPIAIEELLRAACPRLKCAVKNADGASPKKRKKKMCSTHKSTPAGLSV